MLQKTARFTFTDIRPINIDEKSHSKLIRTANSKIFIQPGSDKEQIVKAEINKHTNALFFEAKAIEADIPNTNGDCFSEEELLRAYKSFEGVPFFTNHDNENVENARGKVIYAEWVPEEKAVYTISFVDRDAYPHICRSIEEEYVTGVSMGAAVEYSICNICHNKSEKTEDYCTHIKNRKGRKFTGKARDVVTGELRDFKDELVFEHNYGINFIELSAVVDPACPTCRIKGIIPNNAYLAKAASMENELRMIKVAALEKHASQEEITQIEECLQTLEAIAVSLIQNRQQVEMEFSSDLVKIMSDLQTWMEELVGAGYGNIESASVPGTLGNMEPNQGMAPEQMQQAPQPLEGAAPGQQMPAQQVSDTQSQGEFGVPSTPSPKPATSRTVSEVGRVSGSPLKPSTTSPSLPITSPVKPRLSTNDECKMVRMSQSERKAHGENLLEEIKGLLNSVNTIKGEKNMPFRKTPLEANKWKNDSIEVLSNSWKEKQTFCEYIKQMPSLQSNQCRLSVNNKDGSFIIVAEDKGDSDKKQIWTYEDLSNDERQEIQASPKNAAINMLNRFANNLNNKIKGVDNMSQITKEAGATTVQETPDTVQENQLDRSDLYHARQNDDKHTTTQKQLEELRKGEQDVITEKQLANNEGNRKGSPRTSEVQDVITEAQMDGDNRLGEDKHEITQKQLVNDGKRVDNEPDVITEKQLSDMAAPWARTASRDPKLFKNATAHMDAVINVMADTTIKCGCTPEETVQAASSLVDSVQSRYNFASSLTESGTSSEQIDYAKRVAFWKNKNLRMASAGTKDIVENIVDSLRQYAGDTSYNPDVLIDAVDIVSENDVGINRIASKVSEKIRKAHSEKTVSVNRKSELRNALMGKSESDKGDKTAVHTANSARRKKIEASLQKTNQDKPKILNQAAIKNADTIIETSFGELGCKQANPNFKKEIVSFARGALASQNIKMASITNVTISGDTIQIAVETDTDRNEVNIDSDNMETTIPVDQSAMPMDSLDEGDLSGENLQSGNQAWASSKKKLDVKSSKNSSKLQRKAQSPMGGGIPGTPGGVAAPGAPEQGLPGGVPSDMPIQSLTAQDPAEAESEDIDIPVSGEKQMPWATCPECGSNDVDVTNEGGDINGSCNNCGAEYEAMITKTVEFKLIKPTKSIGEDGLGDVDAPEAPDVPALPVAAQTKLDKTSLVRIANNKKKHGNVCPACGNRHCTASVETEDHSEFTCDKCGTQVEKDILVDPENYKEAALRTSWDVTPNLENCESCKKAAMKFASQLKIGRMLKTASANKDNFPRSACMEMLARKYGGDTVASFGPCKGKLLAECACDQLEKLGLKKVRHLNKFASASMQSDPWDECIEEQTKNEGLSVNEAETLCGCLKTKWASKWNDNIFAHAFANDIEQGIEKDLTLQDIETLHDVLIAEEQQKAKVIAQKLREEDEREIDTADEAEAESVVESQSKGENVKTAKKLNLVEHIEGDVEAGVPRSKANIRNENASNIDVPLNKPQVPRNPSRLGQESESNIDPKVEGPDVPINSEYLGDERNVQKNYDHQNKGKGMPNISDKIKGTVIADAVELTIKNGRIVHMAKKMKEIDTVEDNVEAGVPRSKATMGEEGADNIDVPLNKPQVPRNPSRLGQEDESNIDPKVEGPDVPIDSQYMGGEKSVQDSYDHKNGRKGMPGINDEMLKQVKQQRGDVSQKREAQKDRILQARRNEAIQTAAWLTANSRIPNDQDTFNNVVTALMAFETDQIQVKATAMFPAKTVKASSNRKAEGHSIPAIVIESKQNETQERDLADRLADTFTIGNSMFDHSLTLNGIK